MSHKTYFSYTPPPPDFRRRFIGGDVARSARDIAKDKAARREAA